MALLEEVLPALKLGKKITRLDWGYSACIDILDTFVEITDKESFLANDWVILEDYQILNHKLESRLKDINYILDCEWDNNSNNNELKKKIQDLISEGEYE
jgi:hypothetical protein